MLSENSNKQKKSLSIHYFKKGFSFCTTNSVDFFSHPGDMSEFEYTFRDFLEKNYHENFEYFSIIFFQNPSTLVPYVFFDNQRLDDYLNLYFKKPKAEIVIFDKLINQERINIYSVPKKIYNIIDKLDIDFNIFHYNSLLIKRVLNLSSIKKFSKQLFIHLHFNAMDIFLVKNKSLLFNNRFIIKKQNDFMYYLFFVIEQFNLGPHQFDIVFLGRIDAFESYYEIVKHYHSNITFTNEEPSINLKFSKHHAPYLSPYFN